MSYKRKAYFAAPFFDTFTFEGVAKYADKIRRETGIDIYVPQENMGINDKSKEVTNKMIYQGDLEELRTSSILIAYIDGMEIDSGVACEIGIWCGWNDLLLMNEDIEEPLPLIAIYSDMRRDGKGDGKFYKNQFVLGGVEFNGVVVKDFDEAIEAIKRIQKGDLI